MEIIRIVGTVVSDVAKAIFTSMFILFLGMLVMVDFAFMLITDGSKKERGVL